MFTVQHRKVATLSQQLTWSHFVELLPIEYEKADGEESPVALILCAEKSQETIELLELDKGSIHVGQYLTKMPPKELLQEKLSLAISNAREQLRQRIEE